MLGDRYDVFFYISVPTHMTTKQGVDLVHRYPLEAAAFQKSPKFVLAREDPAVYTNEDLEGYNPSREWPEEDLPTAPEPQAAPTFSAELIRKGLSIHHLYCDWLKALGVDPCKEYANQGNTGYFGCCCSWRYSLPYLH